jgi:hypothetical protein
VSDGVSYKLQGFEGLDAALDELPKATKRNAMTRAATNALKPMVERMAQYAPFDPEDRDEDGRHLNESMRTQTAKAALARQLGTDRQKGVVVLAGPAPVGKRARANAGWQEHGTVKMPAHSYARVAADVEARNVIQNVRDELRGQIDKAKARMKRKAARR